MPRNGSGVYSLPGGSTITNGDTSDASDLNTPLADLVSDANAARPIVAGGTGAVSASAALVNLGLTATAAEINLLDGATLDVSAVTATATELNALDGITATVTELNYTDGVTSNIQTQLNAKAPTASPTFTGVPAAPTAATGTDTTQVATTAYVVDEIPNQLNATGTAPIFACRAWGLVDASSGTPVVSGSGNVASITDLGVGTFQVNFTTAMTSANYAVIGSAKGVDDINTTPSNRTILLPYSLSTTSFRFVITEASSNAPTDAAVITFAVFG